MSVDMDYTGRWVVTAKGSSRQAWLNIAWQGQGDAVHELPDGRDLVEVIDANGLATLDFPLWFEVEQSGSYDDLLWTTLGAYLIVSDKFLEILGGFQDYGYEHRPLEIRRSKGQPPVTGHNLFIATTTDQNAHLRPFPLRKATSSVDVSIELLTALKRHKVTGMDVKDAPTWWSMIQENLALYDEAESL
ncbi:hypothetical protein ACFSYH_10490 [Populibacterium corticicola]|uniref:Uncharacterized protein n=1 Tax=Populibacterium corticicola TaxID=1812826 RepID=A0ABW5XEU0_9MICO